MTDIKGDIPNFLRAIDFLAESLEPPRRLQDAGVPECTQRQLGILKALNRYDYLPMSKLARIVDVPLSTATRIVDQLVVKDLLVRKSSQQDARVIEVGFTELGKEINRYIDQSRHERALAILSALPDKERAVFLCQLEKLLNV